MKKLVRNPVLALSVWAVLVPGIPAWSEEPKPTTGDETATPAAEDAEISVQERRRRAKEVRIEQYLLRREERRARRALAQAAPAPTTAPAAAAPSAAPSAAPNDVSPAATAAVLTAPPVGKLPKQLARAQENVRASALGNDPTVQVYLARIDEQRASPEQLAAFGSFVAENGLIADALAYYDIALHLEPDNPLFWLNYGTLQRQDGNLSRAMSAYQRVLDVDPNNAMAHYNIGAIQDSQRKYEAAIESFTRALELDPNLGDPALNPQAAQNERLLAVKLKLYRQQVGSLGLPLSEIVVPKAEEPPGNDDKP